MIKPYVGTLNSALNPELNDPSNLQPVSQVYLGLGIPKVGKFFDATLV